MEDSILNTPDSLNVECGSKRNASPLQEEMEKRLKMDDLNEVSLARLIRSITQEVMTTMSNDLKKEISLCCAEVVRLWREIEGKDVEIESLRERIDHLEQYGRRENVRINGIPEPEDNDENTNAVVLKLAESIGVDLFEDHINRSHRIGRKGDFPRPIICRFHSTKDRDRLMKMKKNLRDLDTMKHFGCRKIFLNEDLTKTRAEIASAARKMKKESNIDDTWTRNGVICVKKDGRIVKVTTMKQLDTAFNSLVS